MKRDARVHLRLHADEKDSWEQQAGLDGFWDKGEVNVSGWLRWLAEKRIKAVRTRRSV